MDRPPASRLVLGTVQLGLPYGVANTSGQPAPDAALRLLEAAWKAGIDTFDTAAAYGSSEQVLGQSFATLGLLGRVHVVSKGSLPARDATPSTLAEILRPSFERLRVPALAAWLLHDESQLDLWNDAFAAEAAEFIRAGKVRRFGVSVYRPQAALRAVEQLRLAALQFPASPLDRRFLRGDVPARLAASGAGIHIRSVFLQGLCLMTPDAVPAGIARGREAAATLREFCGRHSLAPDQFCLHYVLARSASLGARLVVGLETPSQLERNLRLVAEPPPDPALFDAWDQLWPDDIEDLILPTRWPRKA